MCLHPKHIVIPNPYPTIAYPEHTIELDVPCGKCLQCLKRRQSDYAIRLYNEVKDGRLMFFVTLTYNNSSLPLAITYKHIDLVTGEILDSTKPVLLTEEDSSPEFVSFCRSKILSMKSGFQPRVIRGKCLLGTDGIGYYYEVTPTLCRNHVQQWIKKCRIQYKRDYGTNMNFRVAYCGEYGPRGCRPHYHLIFIGASFEQIMYMLNYWRFGYTNHKFVPMLNPDGSNAREIAARYIGKYVSKGKFDCESVKLGISEKGRLCNSKRFGTLQIDSKQIAYYRAYDLFGAYNTNTLDFVNADSKDLSPT